MQTPEGMAKEPQSYGSQADWVEGNVGETVNKQKSEPTAKHDDFYENRVDSESSTPVEGGQVSDRQLAENGEGSDAASDETQPMPQVTDKESGATPGGYFKDRDYKG